MTPERMPFAKGLLCLPRSLLYGSYAAAKGAQTTAGTRATEATPVTATAAVAAAAGTATETPAVLHAASFAFAMIEQPLHVLPPIAAEPVRRAPVHLPARDDRLGFRPIEVVATPALHVVAALRLLYGRAARRAALQVRGARGPPELAVQPARGAALLTRQRRCGGGPCDGLALWEVRNAGGDVLGKPHFAQLGRRQPLAALRAPRRSVRNDGQLRVLEEEGGQYGWPQANVMDGAPLPPLRAPAGAVPRQMAHSGQPAGGDSLPEPPS
eukprot:CAMPEP_0198517312 /NCGR_PEP_ID=MMETSP1462-20131121/18453_1 /TAXON_ID=1333877 /ORGANISM="Brandtodinium nutriculum, Strain RCC3387" /LENGTH=268 /DNA_ID=CAMNT_0044246871 /DNA_START=306 /DNA_END=1109 /DNA_ORIENTATION=-